MGDMLEACLGLLGSPACLKSASMRFTCIKAAGLWLQSATDRWLEKKKADGTSHQACSSSAQMCSSWQQVFRKMLPATLLGGARNYWMGRYRCIPNMLHRTPMVSPHERCWRTGQRMRAPAPLAAAAGHASETPVTQIVPVLKVRNPLHLISDSPVLLAAGVA